MEILWRYAHVCRGELRAELPGFGVTHPYGWSSVCCGTSLAYNFPIMFDHPGEAKGRAPARILVAEDDPDLRALISLALSQAGFDVDEAADGAGLLERMASSLEDDGTLDHYDVIVSDIQMPNFTALDVLAGAQRLVTRTPMLLITAFDDRRTRERALQLGAAGVLLKPVSMDDLCLEVCRLLTRPLSGVTAT